MFRLTPGNLGWIAGYLLMLAAIAYGLNHYRTSAVAHYGTDAAGAKWQTWRQAADSLGRDGPVEREAPESVEPPALVLMRDHFAACLGISLLLSSCLYVWFVVSVRGALRPVELNYEADEQLPNP